MLCFCIQYNKYSVTILYNGTKIWREILDMCVSEHGVLFQHADWSVAFSIKIITVLKQADSVNYVQLYSVIFI